MIWKSRIDCWYEPHRDIGQKAKSPKRLVRWVMVDAPDSESAVKAALEFTERTASPSFCRRWLSFEHRQTGSLNFPMDVAGP